MYIDKCECEEYSGPAGHYYTFTGPCVVTGKSYFVKVKAHELYRFRQGDYIQDAFPTMSADDREFLMSGMSPEGWTQAFGDEED